MDLATDFIEGIVLGELTARHQAGASIPAGFGPPLAEFITTAIATYAHLSPPDRRQYLKATLRRLCPEPSVLAHLHPLAVAALSPHLSIAAARSAQQRAAPRRSGFEVSPTLSRLLHHYATHAPPPRPSDS